LHKAEERRIIADVRAAAKKRTPKPIKMLEGAMDAEDAP
jgi:hypothetical protein